MIGRAGIAVALGLSLAACAAGPDDRLHFERTPNSVARDVVGTPQFLFGSGGDIEMIAAVQRGGVAHLEAFSSRSQGDTFIDEGPVSPVGVDIDAIGESSPRFAMDRNELLYALWRQDSPATQLFVAVHDWRTGKYAKPIPIRDAEARGYAGFADMAVGRDNTVYFVWLDERDLKESGDSSAVYFTALKDGHVSRNVRVASSTCSCCRPTVTVAGDGTIYVAWRHDNHDVRDMAVAASRDGGRTFSAMRYVAHDGWKLHGCPESGPSLLAAGRRLYVAWFTEGADARPRVLLAHSDDGGVTFTTPVEVSAPMLDANHPRLFAMKPSGVAVVFQARDPQTGGGWSHLVPYIARIRDDGTTSAPQPIAAPGTSDGIYPYAVSRDAQSTFVSYTLGQRAAILRGRP